MQVLSLVLAYDGTDFHGFARQPGRRTIQGVLEEALARVLRVRPRVSVAGRTDAGVHAEGQVVSFEGEADPARVQRAVNAMLAPEIVVRRAMRAPEGFDARRSAVAREYLYRIRTAALPSPFDARYVWHRPGRLPVGGMRRAAQYLIGEHDFRSFCRAGQGSTIRRVDRLSVSARGELMEIRVEANAFLHQMVRSLVGTLVAVGEGRMDPEAMPAVLAARSRRAAGAVAPPHGLTLVRVRYGTRPASGRA